MRLGLLASLLFMAVAAVVLARVCEFDPACMLGWPWTAIMLLAMPASAIAYVRVRAKLRSDEP